MQLDFVPFAFLINEAEWEAHWEEVLTVENEINMWLPAILWNYLFFPLILVWNKVPFYKEAKYGNQTIVILRIAWVQLNGHEFEEAPGDGEGQGSLVCCSPWGHKESDTT